MHQPRDGRSVIDSLSFLYKFLTDKYSEELRGFTKNGKKKKKLINSNNQNENKTQQKNTNAEVTTEIIHNLNENKKQQQQIDTKVFNIKTKKLQKKKKKQSDVDPPIDYQPIPFNFLSTKYKNTKTQVDTINEPDIQYQYDDDDQFQYDDHFQYSIDNLKENYELVSYLSARKIKSDAFTRWSKSFYYSVIKKKSFKSNQFYFEANPKQTLNQNSAFTNDYQNSSSNAINERYSCVLSSELQLTKNLEIQKVACSNLANIKNSDHVQNSNSDDERDRYVDIVLSEDSFVCT